MDILKQLKAEQKEAQNAYDKALELKTEYKGSAAAEIKRQNLKITATWAFLKRKEMAIANFENSFQTAA